MKKLYVSMAVVALAFVFVGSAVAADWNFYGSARMTTFRNTLSQENLGNPMTDNPLATANTTVNSDDLDVNWGLQGNSRFGARVSAGNVSGRVEMSVSQANVGARLLYGKWNFGSGSFTVGQDYTPSSLAVLLSNQVVSGDLNLLGIGAPYAGRLPQAKVEFSGFKLALIKPNLGASTGTGIPGTAVDTDVTLPKLELGYKYASDMWFVNPYAGYQTYDEVNTNDNSESVASFLIGTTGGMNFQGGFFFKANLYYASNAGPYGIGNGALPTYAVPAGVPIGTSLTLQNPVWVGTELKDQTEYGGILVLGYAASFGALEAGFGYRDMEVDLTTKLEQTAMSYYLNATINLTDGVFVVPEIGMIDYGDLETSTTKNDLGSDFYFGAKWQVNF